jgi:bifunctional non-homologous end joining protein LigD
MNRLTQVRFTNLQKILYPQLRISKKDVIEYYIRVAPRMLPFLHDRPMVMHRYPNGVGGKEFYEKDAPEYVPGFVDTFTRYSKSSDRDVHFVMCNSLDALLWVANLASIEMHITLSTASAYDEPDLIFIDLDPGPQVRYDEIIEVVHYIRDRLQELGLIPYVKTSGKRGLHIVAPIRQAGSFEETRRIAHDIGRSAAAAIPNVVSDLSQAKSPRAIFVDYLQNAQGKTMAAPYSLRGTQGCTVSAPLTWDELVPGLNPEHFNIRTILPRSDDPWRGILEHRKAIQRGTYGKGKYGKTLPGAGAGNGAGRPRRGSQKGRQN